MFVLAVSLAILLGVTFWWWLEDHARLVVRINHLERERSEEREKSEREQGMRELFESLLDEMNHAVIITDTHLCLTHANRRAGHLFPRSPVRLGMTLMEVVRQEQILDLARRVFREGLPLTALIHVEEPGDMHLQVDCALLPPALRGGVWLMISDVTERIRMEQIRRDFVTNASHELRTPLTLLRGYIESLQEGHITEPKAIQRSLSVMSRHTLRLQRLTEDMLTISRLERPEPLLDMAPFRVADCVAEVLEQLQSLIQQRAAIVLTDFQPADGQIHGDRFYWDQIFINLIENALKENEEPGLQIRVSGKWHADSCKLCVEDNGIGIPASDLPFIFKRFYRGVRHSSRASTTRGTGLGLSIVKRGIEAHQGSISVESEPAVRTAFVIQLPLVTEA
jgi:two-component system, OmpR family, phosphate regulon sensor histidine kinase PhoR